MIASKPITLVVAEAQVRAELAHYLTEAGFAVDDCATPPDPTTRPGALVWVTEREQPATLIETTVNAWLSAAPSRRAVVVTWRATAFRDLIDAAGDRLVLLTPPIFGWDLVDALRAADRAEPPGEPR